MFAIWDVNLESSMDLLKLAIVQIMLYVNKNYLLIC